MKKSEGCDPTGRQPPKNYYGNNFVFLKLCNMLHQ